MDFSKVSPYAIAGPRFDILLHRNPDGFQVVIDKFNTIDAGVTVGVGAEINLSRIQFLTEVRLSPNLTNSYSTDILTVRGNSMEFLLGLRWGK